MCECMCALGNVWNPFDWTWVRLQKDAYTIEMRICRFLMPDYNALNSNNNKRNNIGKIGRMTTIRIVCEEKEVTMRRWRRRTCSQVLSCRGHPTDVSLICSKMKHWWRRSAYTVSAWALLLFLLLLLLLLFGALLWFHRVDSCFRACRIII